MLLRGWNVDSPAAHFLAACGLGDPLRLVLNDVSETGTGPKMMGEKLAKEASRIVTYRGAEKGELAASTSRSGGESLGLGARANVELVRTFGVLRRCSLTMRGQELAVRPRPSLSPSPSLSAASCLARVPRMKVVTPLQFKQLMNFLFLRLRPTPQGRIEKEHRERAHPRLERFVPFPMKECSDKAFNVCLTTVPQLFLASQTCMVPADRSRDCAPRTVMYSDITGNECKDYAARKACPRYLCLFSRPVLLHPPLAEQESLSADTRVTVRHLISPRSRHTHRRCTRRPSAFGTLTCCIRSLPGRTKPHRRCRCVSSSLPRLTQPPTAGGCHLSSASCLYSPWPVRAWSRLRASRRVSKSLPDILFPDSTTVGSIINNFSCGRSPAFSPQGSRLGTRARWSR